MPKRLTLLKVLVIICVLIVTIVLLRTVYSLQDFELHTYHPRNVKDLQQSNYDQHNLPIKKGKNGFFDIRKTNALHLNGLDKTSAPSETELIDLSRRELPNLPFEFLVRNAGQVLQKNATCAPHANLFELHYHNDYWQTYTNKNASFQLYGAYMDDRASLENEPMVRILGMASQIFERFPHSYCQLWFDNRTEPDIVPVSQYLPIWYSSWGGTARNVLFPHLLGCVLPEDSKLLIPQSVSVVAEKCARATNAMRVNYIKPHVNATKHGFAICVKGLDFPYSDISDRLVEWLEMMRVLGADKIFIYTLQMHPNITKVLNYYEALGLVELSPLTLARGPSPSNFRHLAMRKNHLNKSLNELIPYNDCFYKHMYEYEYIAVIDIDEVIMPLGNLSSWRDIVVAAKQSQSPDCAHTASVCFRNVYFPNDRSGGLDAAAPRNLHMLRHVTRVANHSEVGWFIKCLHNTEHVVIIHNHGPIRWQQSCGPRTLNIVQAQSQHYREPRVTEDFQSLVQDANIWRFKDTLVNRTTKVFSELGFF